MQPGSHAWGCHAAPVSHAACQPSHVHTCHRSQGCTAVIAHGPRFAPCMGYCHSHLTGDEAQEAQGRGSQKSHIQGGAQRELKPSPSDAVSQAVCPSTSLCRQPLAPSLSQLTFPEFHALCWSRGRRGKSSARSSSKSLFLTEDRDLGRSDGSSAG